MADFEEVVKKIPRVSEICANTTRRGTEDVREHRELGKILMGMTFINFSINIFLTHFSSTDNGVFSPLDEFETVANNPKLGAGIVSLLGTGLTDKIEESLYGAPYCSDLDLRLRGVSHKQLTEYLEPRLKGTKQEKINIIDNLFHVKRKSLNRWLGRLKDTVILNFGIDGCYDVNQKKREDTKQKKKSSPCSTEKTIAQLKAESLEKSVRLFAESSSPDLPEAVYKFVLIHK